MAFNKEAFAKVGREFSAKKESADCAAERRRKEVEQSVQGIKEIHDELKSIGISMLGAAIGVVNNPEDIIKSAAALNAQKMSLLVSAGYPADYTEPRYECKRCNDTGYESGKMCTCFHDALVIAQLDVSGLGELARTQSFDNFNLHYYADEMQRQMGKYKERLQSFARNFNGESEASWLLTGAAGLGKTHLTTATAVEIVQKSFDVIYMAAIDLFETFQEKTFRDGDVDTAKFYEAELLIIDDLGTEVSNQFTVSRLFSLVDKRKIKGLPTIINTNLSRDEMFAKYGDRITSRLWSYYNVLQFEGTDVRMQQLRESIHAR